MKLAEIRDLAASGKCAEALTQLDALLVTAQECPYFWTFRANLILLGDSDSPPLAEVAENYSRALELDSDNLEALEGLAHYYDALDPDPDKAKKYARDYVENAKPVIDAMERILVEEC